MSREIVETENTYLPSTLKHEGLKTSLATLNRDGPALGTFLKLTKTGKWVYGADDIEIKKGSRWAVNMYSSQSGFIAWGDEGSPADKEIPEENMFLMTDYPNPSDVPTLRDMPIMEHFTWRAQSAIHLRGLDGESTGVDVVYKTSAKGGLAELRRFTAQALDGMDTDGREDARLIPVVAFSRVEVKHKTYGDYFKPVIVMEDVYTIAEMKNQPDEEPDAEPEPEPEKPARAKRPRRTRA